MTRIDWDKANRRDQARPERQATEVVAWWWTPARKKSWCTRCGHSVTVGTPIAYNHSQAATYCQDCVTARELSPRNSAAMVKMLRVAQQTARKAERRGRQRKAA